MKNALKNNNGIKIVATIGPASEKYSILVKMVDAGMDIARLNTKYADEKQIFNLINRIKKANEVTGKKCEILIDLLTLHDLKLISFLKKQDIDYVALAFTETTKQIKELEDSFYPKKIKFVSKIESRRGINNIDKLIDKSWGIMIARGDLGKNIAFEKLPVFQKLIIKKCKKKGCKTITATEMLLSMVGSKVPSRSESSDVANAVLDGTDMLMLSEETSIGRHPVHVIQTMKKIIYKTLKYKYLLKD